MMRMRLVQWARHGKFLAIQLYFIMTFGLAAYEKWAGGGVPDWFLKQFGQTILARGPGGPAASFFTIALLESACCLGFLASLVRLEFLIERSKVFMRLSLTLALFVFVMLGFGQRLTAQYDAAALLLIYFIGTLVALQICEKEDHAL